MAEITCTFCNHIFTKDLSRQITIVECPKCFAVVEFMKTNTTTPPETCLLMRVIKKGEMRIE